jgi:hypothetical protein
MQSVSAFCFDYLSGFWGKKVITSRLLLLLLLNCGTHLKTWVLILVCLGWLHITLLAKRIRRIDRPKTLLLLKLIHLLRLLKRILNRLSECVLKGWWLELNTTLSLTERRRILVLETTALELILVVPVICRLKSISKIVDRWVLSKRLTNLWLTCSLKGILERVSLLLNGSKLSRLILIITGSKLRSHKSRLNLYCCWLGQVIKRTVLDLRSRLLSKRIFCFISWSLRLQSLAKRISGRGDWNLSLWSLGKRISRFSSWILRYWWTDKRIYRPSCWYLTLNFYKRICSSIGRSFH